MWTGHDACTVFMKIEITSQILLDAAKWNFMKFLLADFEFVCADTEGPKEGKSVTGVK
jgi:glutathione peroxidase-family protein